MAFHWQGGWYFERITETDPDRFDRTGYVRIYYIPPGEAVADFDIEIDPDSWASIVASVCPEGESAFTWKLAKALHGF